MLILRAWYVARYINGVLCYGAKRRPTRQTEILYITIAMEWNEIISFHIVGVWNLWSGVIRVIQFLKDWQKLEDFVHICFRFFCKVLECQEQKF